MAEHQLYNFQNCNDGSSRTQHFSNDDNGYHQNYYCGAFQPRCAMINPYSDRIRYRKPKNFNPNDQIKAFIINNEMEFIKINENFVFARKRTINSYFRETDAAGHEDIQQISTVLLENKFDGYSDQKVVDTIKCFILNKHVDFLTIPSKSLVYERNKRNGGLFNKSKRTMEDIANLNLEERPVIFIEGQWQTSVTSEDGTLMRQCRLIILDSEEKEQMFYKKLRIRKDKVLSKKLNKEAIEIQENMERKEKEENMERKEKEENMERKETQKEEVKENEKQELNIKENNEKEIKKQNKEVDKMQEKFGVKMKEDNAGVLTIYEILGVSGEGFIYGYHCDKKTDKKKYYVKETFVTGTVTVPRGKQKKKKNVIRRFIRRILTCGKME